MGVTIKKIAELAGVNCSTVSRALHNDERIKLTTRKQIKEISIKLGYMPNQAARNLVTNKTNSIFFFMNTLTSECELTPARIFNEICAQKDLMFSMMLHNNNLDLYKNMIKRLYQNICDGAIIISPSFIDLDEEASSLLKALPIPVVFFDRWINNSKFPVVTTDNTRMMTNLLTKAITGQKFDGACNLITSTDSVLRLRSEATCEFLKMHGIPCLESIEEIKKRKWKKILIVANSGGEVFDRVAELQSNGIKLKDCTAVICDKTNCLLQPTISNLFYCVQDFELLAKCAIGVLFEQMSDKTHSDNFKMIPHKEIIHHDNFVR